MKRFLILLLAGGLCAFSAGAQQTAQLLDAEGLKAANDSVLLEGYQLYLAERVAWEMEDAFHYCKTKSVDMYGGWFPVTEDGVNVKGIFFDEAKEHVVFEALMNIRTGELSSNDAVRDLTPAEIERIDKRRRMFEAVQTLDDLPRRPAGDDYMFNAEIVQVDEDLFRVYFMLGTAKNGVTPFGCDFSYDCDSEGNVKAFRRYHKTTLLLPTTFDDGSPAVKTAHTHLEMCPLMAPTDIAIFLLYGVPAGMKESAVYSTVYKKWFVFDAEKFEIRVEDQFQ